MRETQNEQPWPSLAGPASGGPFPSLPSGLQRGDIERMLTVLSADLGLSGARLRALLVMMQATRPSDWTAPDRDAVCYMRQQQIAARLGITPRALRAHEVALETAGLIARQFGADGSRGRFAGGALVQGISFAPLITRAAKLLRRHEARLADECRAQVLRRQLSASKRALTRSIGRLLELKPDHPALPGLLDALRAAPRRYEGLDVAALTQAFDPLDAAARAALATLDLQLKTSAVTEETFRPHIQEPTEDNSELCSSKEAQETCRTGEPMVPAKAENAESPGGSHTCCGGAEGSLPRNALTLFDPGQLYRMASEDFRLYLDATHSETCSLSTHDFVQASIALLPALGCNLRLWDQITEELGDIGAALAVLVIDANRTHPHCPIRSVGAALRAFSRLAQAGQLNLAGSLIGLYRRRQAEQELAG
jgi:replication initiation protein RepC